VRAPAREKLKFSIVRPFAGNDSNVWPENGAQKFINQRQLVTCSAPRVFFIAACLSLQSALCCFRLPAPRSPSPLLLDDLKHIEVVVEGRDGVNFERSAETPRGLKKKKKKKKETEK